MGDALDVRFVGLVRARMGVGEVGVLVEWVLVERRSLSGAPGHEV